VDTLHRDLVGRRVAVVIATDTGDGDVHPERVDHAALRARQLSVAPRTWVMVDEVHGVAVHHVTVHDGTSADAPDGPAEHPWPMAGVADVIVTSEPTTPIAIWAADCAPIAMFGDAGTTVVVHAGWRGLATGVVDVALAQFATRHERPAVAVLGPVIHPCCYEFGPDDLDTVAHGVHARPDDIAGLTTEGAPALDVPAAVRTALGDAGPRLVAAGPCTGCGGRWFSHRRRNDAGRHALVAWTEFPTDAAR
jgi:hypothetical protein